MKVYYWLEKGREQVPIFLSQLNKIDTYLNDGYSLVKMDEEGHTEPISKEDMDVSIIRDPVLSYVPSDQVADMLQSLLNLMEASMTPAVALLSVTSTKSRVQTLFDEFKEKVDPIIETYKEPS